MPPLPVRQIIRLPTHYKYYFSHQPTAKPNAPPPAREESTILRKVRECGEWSDQSRAVQRQRARSGRKNVTATAKYSAFVLAPMSTALALPRQQTAPSTDDQYSIRSALLVLPRRTHSPPRMGPGLAPDWLRQHWHLLLGFFPLACCLSLVACCATRFSIPIWYRDRSN